MQDVIVAVDPAKRSHTIEVLDQRERTLATLRIENTTAGYRELRAFVKKWPSRRWAVEGAQGVGRQLAQRMVADGERVIDVPAKLSTRVRVLDTGHGRKNDPADAHAVGVAALRHHDLVEMPSTTRRSQSACCRIGVGNWCALAPDVEPDPPAADGADPFRRTNGCLRPRPSNSSPPSSRVASPAAPVAPWSSS